jgi:hypothetical protein
MSLTSQEDKQAIQIRSNIKAAVGQLDSWTSSQTNHRLRRNAANASSGGRRERCVESRKRAVASQGTQFIEDPPCDLCGSSGHLGDECDFIAVEASTRVAFEDPSAGIHRGIVHRVYSLASELYRLHYPRFYPGLSEETIVRSEAYLLPVPLVGPDYQEIGITQAVGSLVGSSSTQNYLTTSFLSQRSIVDAVAQSFYSAAFPLDYSSFRDRIQEELSETLNLDRPL